MPDLADRRAKQKRAADAYFIVEISSRDFMFPISNWSRSGSSFTVVCTSAQSLSVTVGVLDSWDSSHSAQK